MKQIQVKGSSKPSLQCKSNVHVKNITYYKQKFRKEISKTWSKMTNKETNILFKSLVPHLHCDSYLTEYSPGDS